jgi:NADH-quinone oxidoreductase subunit J
MILFQDAHGKIAEMAPKAPRAFLLVAASSFLMAFLFIGGRLINFIGPQNDLPLEYGTVHSLGHTLYLDFFFPFEIVVLLFLISMVGALYIARKEA